MPDISIRHFFATSKAYFVGVANYRHAGVSTLCSPHHDVKAIKDALTQYHDFSCNPVAASSGESLENPLLDPDRDQMLRFFDSISCTKEDRLLIYIACHGIATNSDEEPEGYLLPADAVPGDEQTFISMRDINEKLKKLDCRHLLLVLDCCYAGAFSWAMNTRGVGFEIPKTIYYEKFEQYATNTAWQVLTSAAYDQKAIDTLRLGKREAHEQQDMSPFAWLFCEALQTGKADTSYDNKDRDMLITLSELYIYLRDEICNDLSSRGITVDRRQIPMMFPLKMESKGEFVFISPVAAKGKIFLDNRKDSNPYKGLEAYEVDDDSIFYGRRRVLDGWEDGNIRYPGLKEVSRNNDLVIITGPSGIGKSSLVKAGILSQYKEQFGPDRIVEMRPGKTPLAVNSSILKSLEETEGKVVLVDQYEELVTLCNDEKQREAFEQALERLPSRHKLLLTVRSDMEGSFSNTALFSGSFKWKRSRFLVPPFSRDEIREIVVQPAGQQMMEFRSLKRTAEEDRKFVERIAEDSFSNPGSLPLLSLALSELYEKREERNLLESVYNSFDGIAGILNKKATAEYESFAGDREGQEYMKELIFRMISFEAGRIARRRIYILHERIEDLAEAEAVDRRHEISDDLIFPLKKKTQKIRNIAQRLAHARLLRTDRDENGKPFLEPSHDALLRSWSLVVRWLKERDGSGTASNETRIRLLHNVSDISKTYALADSGSRKGYLWVQDPRLEMVRKVLRTYLNKVEARFIEDSYRAKEKAQRIRMGIIIGSFLALAIAASIFFIQRNRIAAEARRNHALFLASESDKYGLPEKLSLLKSAFDIHDDPAILSKIYSALNQYEYFDPVPVAQYAAGPNPDSVSFLNDSVIAILRDGKFFKWDFTMDHIDSSVATPIQKAWLRTGVLPIEVNFGNSKKKPLVLKDRALEDYQEWEGGMAVLSSAGEKSYINLISNDGGNREIIIEDVAGYAPLPRFVGNREFIYLEKDRVGSIMNLQGKIIADSVSRVFQFQDIGSSGGKLYQYFANALDEVYYVWRFDPKTKNSVLVKISACHSPLPEPEIYFNHLNDSMARIVVSCIGHGGSSIGNGQNTHVYLWNTAAGTVDDIFSRERHMGFLQLNDRDFALYSGEDSVFLFVGGRILQHGPSSGTYEQINPLLKGEYYFSFAREGSNVKTRVYDNLMRMVFEVHYTSAPRTIIFSRDRRRMAILFRDDQLFVWDLYSFFNPNPFTSEMADAPSRSNFMVNEEDFNISNDGRMFRVWGSILTGSPLPEYTYARNRLENGITADSFFRSYKSPYPFTPFFELATISRRQKLDTILAIDSLVKTLAPPGLSPGARKSIRYYPDLVFYSIDSYIFLITYPGMKVVQRLDEPVPIVSGALFDHGRKMIYLLENGHIRIRHTQYKLKDKVRQLKLLPTKNLLNRYHEMLAPN